MGYLRDLPCSVFFFENIPIRDCGKSKEPMLQTTHTDAKLVNTRQLERYESVALAEPTRLNRPERKVEVRSLPFANNTTSTGGKTLPQEYATEEKKKNSGIKKSKE